MINITKDPKYEIDKDIMVFKKNMGVDKEEK